MGGGGGGGGGEGRGGGGGGGLFLRENLQMSDLQGLASLQWPETRIISKPVNLCWASWLLFTSG